MKYNPKLAILIFITLLSSLVASAGSVRLSVAYPRGSRGISVGDIFYITYEVRDLNGSPSQPKDIPGAKFMYFERTGQSSSITNVMGKMTQSHSYTWTLTLRATQEGQFSFGPVEVDGTKSNVVNYSIGSAAQQTAPVTPQTQNNSQDADNSQPKFIGKGDGNLFLKAEINKSTAYEQEALVYTVKLFTTYDAIKFIGATAAPKFEGFVVEESKDISTSLTYETYNGKTYATAVIARYIIFPQMEGQLKVIGNTYTVSVDEREYYHDPFWGNLSIAKPLQLNVTPNDLNINVKSLPSPTPANFSGGVGQFSIKSSLPSGTLTSNQAASIIYTVEGTGNLKYITLPDLNKLYPPELEVYSPTSDVNISIGRNNVSGSVKFDYSFMPLEAGHYKIPEIDLVYFNPATGTYETSKASGYDISVSQGVGSEKSQTKGNLSFNEALLPVKTNLKLLHKPYILSFPYWLLYIIPVGLLLFASLYYRAYLKSHADILAMKSRNANKMARKRLKKAEKMLNANNEDKFYHEMLLALWGYISEKLRIPTSELNRQNISEILSGKGISEEKIHNFIDLLDLCEFHKYSSSSTETSMKEVFDDGVNVINGLEESFKQMRK